MQNVIIFLGILLSISEGLALSPKVQANSCFQLAVQVIKTVYSALKADQPQAKQQ